MKNNYFTLLFLLLILIFSVGQFQNKDIQHKDINVTLLMNEQRGEFMNYRILFNGEEYEVLDTKQGYITNLNKVDNIYLLGRRPFGETSGFYDDLVIVVESYDPYDVIIKKIENYGGYSPKLFIGKFTQAKTDEILLSIFSGGSGGYSFYYIYQLRDKELYTLFDFEEFNKKFNYSVEYLDNYKILVTNLITNETFIIDISNKPKDYLANLYNNEGKLIKPLQGSVMPLGGLYPIDFNLDGIYELYAMQRIIGQYNADNLGGINSMLKYNNEDFELYNQNVLIIGQKK